MIFMRIDLHNYDQKILKYYVSVKINSNANIIFNNLNMKEVISLSNYYKKMEGLACQLNVRINSKVSKDIEKYLDPNIIISWN